MSAGWQQHPLARTARLLIQETLVATLVTLFYRVRVRGTEHLHGVRGPVLFAPNHCLHWDNGIILTSIPLRWRWRLATAASSDGIYGDRVRGLLASLLAGAFPIERERAIRRGMRLLRERIDRGFNVLIYPEGKLTVGGPTQPFKAGAALVALQQGTPVVPVRVKVRRLSLADRLGWPLRGDVEVVFGPPLTFDRLTDPRDATERLEAAVAAL